MMYEPPVTKSTAIVPDADAEGSSEPHASQASPSGISPLGTAQAATAPATTAPAAATAAPATSAEPPAAAAQSAAQVRFQSCRWRKPAEAGTAAYCTHRDVLPMAGTNGFNPDSWCPDCAFYKLRRVPRRDNNAGGGYNQGGY